MYNLINYVWAGNPFNVTLPFFCFLFVVVVVVIFWVFLFFVKLLYLESSFFSSVAYITVANLARLGISVHCLISVRSQYLVKLLSYRWSHNPPTYRRTVTQNWYRTHTIPKFGLESSWITSACHYIQPCVTCNTFNWY